MTAPSPICRKILDVENMVNTVRNLNEAVLMAAGSLNDRQHVNGIQSVVDEINNKLLAIGDRLEEVRGSMA
jgi:hypothetical protein